MAFFQQWDFQVLSDDIPGGRAAICSDSCRLPGHMLRVAVNLEEIYGADIQPRYYVDVEFR